MNSNLTKESVAAMIDQREYGRELSRDEEAQIKAAGLVVVFGYSDDNAEFLGALHEEVGCYDGGEILLHSTAVLDDSEHRCDCRYCQFEALKAKCAKIKANWCSENGFDWSYETDIPHATFEINDDGEKYCRGIVFSLSDLPTI